MAKKQHGLVPFKGLEALCQHGHSQAGRFSRLFPQLPALYLNPLSLHQLGHKDGVMKDHGIPNLAKTTEAGQIFFGQFIDHDITLDTSSSLTALNDPAATDNVRTPALDLDCIYGQGPEAHPYLYNGAKLMTGDNYTNGGANDALIKADLPRNPNGTAIIGDPRNDENRVISQLQLGFLRFHNAVVDQLIAKGTDSAHLFEEARRLTTWHYQWVVVNDYLPKICGSYVVQDILANGRKIYQPECKTHAEPFIPIEFATAAYRYGHSMIPQKLRIQPGGNQHDLFGSTLGKGFSAIESLDQVVDWEALLDSGNGQYERAAALDIKMSDSLLDLPFLPASTPQHERSLATRNLLRAQSFRLPSGEQVANHLIECGAAGITTTDIATVREAAAKAGMDIATPLWLYILLEGRSIGRLDLIDGQVKASKGEGLGPVGARLVAEVLIGLMELDSRSYLGSNRNWSPQDGTDKLGTNGVNTLYELLTA